MNEELPVNDTIKSIEEYVEFLKKILQRDNQRLGTKQQSFEKPIEKSWEKSAIGTHLFYDPPPLFASLQKKLKTLEDYKSQQHQHQLILQQEQQQQTSPLASGLPLSTKDLRRDILRSVCLCLDLSESSLEMDIRPTRFDFIITLACSFITQFLSFHPLSELTSLTVAQGHATIRTPSRQPAQDYISGLECCQQKQQEKGGVFSLQNTLHSCAHLLQLAPLQACKEIIIMTCSLHTVDTGEIEKTIEYCKKSNIVVHIIGLDAQVHIFDRICRETGGKYFLAINSSELRESLFSLLPCPLNTNSSIPVPSVATTSTTTTTTSTTASAATSASVAPTTQATTGSASSKALTTTNKPRTRRGWLPIAFPTLETAAIKKSRNNNNNNTSQVFKLICFCHDMPCESIYRCPICNSPVCNIPCQCPVCHILLVSYPHIARSASQLWAPPPTMPLHVPHALLEWLFPKKFYHEIENKKELLMNTNTTSSNPITINTNDNNDYLMQNYSHKHILKLLDEFFRPNVSLPASHRLRFIRKSSLMSPKLPSSSLSLHKKHSSKKKKQVPKNCLLYPNPNLKPVYQPNDYHIRQKRAYTKLKSSTFPNFFVFTYFNQLYQYVQIIHQYLNYTTLAKISLNDYAGAIANKKSLLTKTALNQPLVPLTSKSYPLACSLPNSSIAPSVSSSLSSSQLPSSLIPSLKDYLTIFVSSSDHNKRCVPCVGPPRRENYQYMQSTSCIALVVPCHGCCTMMIVPTTTLLEQAIAYARGATQLLVCSCHICSQTDLVCTCTRCGTFLCPDCDDIIHDVLQNCPGCDT